MDEKVFAILVTLGILLVIFIVYTLFDNDDEHRRHPHYSGYGGDYGGGYDGDYGGGDYGGGGYDSNGNWGISDSEAGAANRAFYERQRSVLGMDAYNDWCDAVTYMSLEPGIFKSQANYSDKYGISNSGPSNLSVPSHDVNIVPWVKIRPNARAAYPDPTARTVPSTYLDQAPTRRKWCYN